MGLAKRGRPLQPSSGWDLGGAFLRSARGGGQSGAGTPRARRAIQMELPDRGARKVAMPYGRRVLRYLRPYWRNAIVSLIVIFLAGSVSVLAPWPMQIMVDNVLGRDP